MPKPPPEWFTKLEAHEIRRWHIRLPRVHPEESGKILMSNPTALLQKLWNYCNILRDDGRGER